MNEFNPTSEDLLNLDTRIIDIKTQRAAFIARKIELQNSLFRLKAMYSQYQPNTAEWKRIKMVRDNVKTHLIGIELKIKSLNDEIAYKNKLRLEVDHHVRSNPESRNADLLNVLAKIKNMKKKYSDFAKDRTRIASLRVVASEVEHELDSIIKSL